MGGIIVEVVDLTRIGVTAGAADRLVKAGDVEVLVFVVDVVVDPGAVATGAEQRGLTVVLSHLTEHGVEGVEAVVGDGVGLVVDLNVLVAVVDGGSQGHTLRSCSVHSDLGAVAQYHGTLLALPVFQVLFETFVFHYKIDLVGYFFEISL